MLWTVHKIREHHVVNVVNNRLDSSNQVMALRGKLHKSIVNSQMCPISSLGDVVPPVLHITLD